MAAVVTREGDQVTDAKITLGAVAPTVFRARKAEAILKGQKLDTKVIEDTGRWDIAGKTAMICGFLRQVKPELLRGPATGPSEEVPDIQTAQAAEPVAAPTAPRHMRFHFKEAAG